MCGLIAGFTAFGFSDGAIGAALTRMPVSYTHLDVYKRQLFVGAILAWMTKAALRFGGPLGVCLLYTSRCV